VGGARSRGLPEASAESEIGLTESKGTHDGVDLTDAGAALALANAFFESLDVGHTCWSIAQAMSRALVPAQCVVYLYEHAANELVAAASSDARVGDLAGARLSFGEQRLTVDTVRGLADPGVGSRLLEGDDYAELRRLLCSGTALALPLAVHAELVGVLLVVSFDDGAPIDERRGALASDLARLAGIALQNACLYRNAMRAQGRLEDMLTRMSQVRERERKTFAATVHDDLLQPMVGAIYALDALRDTVTEDGLADFDHVLRMLRLSVEDSRKIIWELRPAVLDGIGLAEALGVIADRIAVESDVKVITSLREVERAGETVSTAAYKIGREALLNAERHSGARNIAVRLDEMGPADAPCLELEVRDDGYGFETEGAVPARHYGLVMMEEQAAAVGGVLQVTSAPGAGTVVRLVVPLVRHSRAVVE